MNKSLIKVLLICVLPCSAIAGTVDDGPDPTQKQVGNSAPEIPDTSQQNGLNTLTFYPYVPDYRISCVFAVKTNLLFDAVGGLNLGVEVPVGCFSVMADFAYAKLRINNRFALQTLQFGAEGKYWFAPNGRPLSGWNLGVYATYSDRYDIQWKDGWQGDGFVSLGLTGGYALPISRSLNLEFAAAAGAFYTPEIRKYSRPQDGHLIWEETRQNVWRVFPTKLKVNLVWLIQSKRRVAVQ